MKTSTFRTARGFSLIEVMVAVIVLAVGLLALAALQGELFRSGAESKARANAATIAQQVIEDARTFGFVSAPNEDYEDAGHNTYNSLATAEWEVPDVAGVTYDVTRDVTRYRYNGATFVENAVDPFSISVPEFKMIRVVVSWTDSNGQAKSVQMADSIAAISPSDVAKVMEGESEASQGPTVWIEPPNKDNPRVVPIAVGDDQSAASSNPTPEQFIEDVSNITKFSVMSFTGAVDGDEVQLTRKLDMAAASCICEEGGSSSPTNPAYEAVVWNGVALAYEEPQTMPVGTPIGTAVVGNADSESEPICTICCRDHFNEDRSPLPDPYRAPESGDTVATKYGYDQQGNSYNVQDLLTTDDTDGLFVDACQLVRVNGRMRMMVDAMQTSLVTTSLDESGTEYRIDDFIDQYSGYVTTTLTEGMANLPDDYPSSTSKFPGPSSSADVTYASIVTPAAVAVEEEDVVNLVTFGLYVDYLSEDTKLAYQCALDDDNTGDCAGLGDRAPLDVLPFYAVNVASLGDWASSGPSVVTVASAGYDNQGQLDTVGGIVTGEGGSSAVDGDGDPIPTPVTLTINNSNSGLAGTAAVDLHDRLSANYVSDAQGFTSGTVDPDPDPDPTTNYTITITVVKSYSPNMTGFTITMLDGTCVPSNQNKNWVCTFPDTVDASTITFSNYQKVAGNGNLQENRKVCVPSQAGIFAGDSVINSNTATETSTLSLAGMADQNYSFQIDVIQDIGSETCTTGLVAAQ